MHNDSKEEKEMKKTLPFRSDLPVTKITENVYLLDEFGGTNCYLVIGETGALLIDCGTGFCDLRGAVRKLTDLPLTVVATHGHVDHLGGAGQFEEIYVPEKDCNKTALKIHRSWAVRMAFFLYSNPVKLNGFKAGNLQKPEMDTKIIPFGEDKTFDLGGKVITVKNTPGHTRGSVALIDEKDGIVFCGDNVCDMLWLFVPGCSSVEEWMPGAQWLYEMSKTHRVFWGHRTPELSTEYIGQVIGYGKGILENTKKNAKFSKIAQYPKQPDGIFYRTGNVFKK